MLLFIKSAFARIKKTFGRFLSLLLIVGLGLGFFAGVRSTSTDMLITADDYFDKSKLFQYDIVSTYGLNDDDIESIKKLSHADYVVGSYRHDTIINSKVYRFHAIENDVNKVTLKSGRMPNSTNECLVEDGVFKLGQKISIDKTDNINGTEFEVVGTITSPMYIGVEKGITNIGNGKLNSFIYILKDAFTMDYYTDCYILNNDVLDTMSYSDEYDKKIEPLESELKDLKPIRETLRYEEILEKAYNEINKQEDKINKLEQENRKKLDDGLKQINKGKREIKNGKYKLEQGRRELEQKKKDTYKELDDTKIKLDNGQKLLNQKEQEFLKTKDATQKQLNEGKEQLKVLKKTCDDLLKQIESLEQLDPNNPQLPVLKEQYNTLIKTYDDKNKEILGAEKALTDAENKIKEEKEKIKNGYSELENGRKTADSEFAKAEKKLEENRILISKNESKLKKEEKKYNNSLKEFNDKIKDAKDKIEDAKEEVNKLKKPVWYLQDRTDLTAYTDFKNDALRVDNIAKVFPVFFLLVAALVCLNTMTRMVEEERTEVGLYKALGYSNYKIISNFFSYVTIATLLGGVIGLLLGYNIFPKAIYSIYSFTYSLPDLIIKINPVQFTVIILISLTITLSVTWYSCFRELKENPASLLRPKAPKNGKKVLLEHIPFIWNRLNFSAKITVRNLFRYKKRIFMTILGISGCTALTLTGFGLRDGISKIIEKQYTDLFKYDMFVAINSDSSSADDYDDLTYTLSQNNIKDPMYVYQELYNFKAENKKHDFFLITPKDTKMLDEYIVLQDRKTKKKIPLDDTGAIITEKMASLLNVKVGDNIKITNSDNKLAIIRVSGIVENYTYHFVYLTENYYKKVMGEEPDYNLVYADLKDDSLNKDDIATSLIESDKFINPTFTSSTIKTFDSMIISLNRIVLVILISSSLLALIVLYNLTNINILERKRELATLKVLGFYDKEVSEYIYRETIILTIFGIFAGLVLGVFLHRFVMDTAEMDFIMFLKEIRPESYVYASLITLLFSFIVAIITHFKLKKINMVDSLKSVE